MAPLEYDVSSHKSLLSVVSHTTNEVDKFDALTPQAQGSMR
jgi:hypothetical protein